MSENIKIQVINPNNFEFQEYSSNDLNLISAQDVEVSFNPSDDYIEYYVYDLSGSILVSNIFGYPNYKLINNQVSIDPVADLASYGYEQGSYNTLYNFLKRKLGSNPLATYYIDEISADRTEIRLNTTEILDTDVVTLTNEFITEIQNSPFNYIDFCLNFGDNQLVIANNILLDNTDPNDPTILIKLYEPLPSQFSLKSTCWIVQQIASSLAYNISITPTFNVEDDNVYLKSPNFNLAIQNQINNSTDYANYKTLSSTTSSLSTGTGSLNYQLNNILAQTGITINIDYSNYSNFIHFSSAQTRLENFYYKLSLLEEYTYSSSLSVGSSSGSYYVSSSNIVWQAKINEIITTFDSYEYYLYYSSGSSAWPKTNSNPPYVNVSTTSTEGQNWFITQSVIAEEYDLENNNALVLAIPSYIIEDTDNLQFELFVEMIGQMFDNVFVYLQGITDKYSADNRLNYGVSKDLVADILRDMGITLYQNNFSSNDVYQALIGITPSGSLYNLPYTTTQYPVPTGSFLDYITTYVTSSSTSSLAPTDDINKEQYKRIYHNLPLLLKKKGSVAGVRDLITTFGITDTILRINEFGGKDKNPNSFDSWQDEYNYSFYTSGSAYVSSSFVLNSSWNAPSNNPQAVEFRFKTTGLPTNTGYYSQSLWSTDNGVAIRLRYTGSGYTTASYSGGPLNPYYQFAHLDFIPDITSPSISASIYLPFYDGGWWSILLNKTGSNFTLYAGNKNYKGEDGNVVSFQSSSSLSASSTVWDGSTISYFGTSSLSGKIFSGSFQEIRYYTQPISKSNFDAYIMNPYSTELSEYLAFRATLGGELYTSSISVHPKVTGSWIITSSFASNSIFSTSSGGEYIPNTEVFYFDQVPAGIQNIVSSKIKQQNIVLPYSSSFTNIPDSNVLSPFISVQQFPSISASYTRDIDYVEVGFSPQNEINEDINSTFGYFNLGDVIGDPRFQSSSLDTYPDLDALSYSYFEKYESPYDWNDYIRLIKFFDNSLFKMLVDWTPARTSLAAGIIIKNTLLDRNRYRPPQVTTSASLANVGSGSTNIPYIVEDQTITGSIEIGTVEGGNGGSMPDLLGQTSSLFTYPGAVNIDQVWYGSTPSLSGSVPFTESAQSEFYNGQLSGSNLIVTNGDLSDYTIDIVPVYSGDPLYANNPVLTDSQSFPNNPYNFNFDKVYYISFTAKRWGSPSAGSTLYLLNNGDPDPYGFNESALFKVTIPGNNLGSNSGSVTVEKAQIQGVIPQTRFFMFTGGGSNGYSSSIENFTIFESEISDPNYLVVENDVPLNRPSSKYMDVDFTTNAITAVNEQDILSGSATRFAVPDSNYTSLKSANPRYFGCKVTTYESRSAGQTYTDYFGYFTSITASINSNLNWPFPGGYGNVNVTTLIDINGNSITLGPQFPGALQDIFIANFWESGSYGSAISSSLATIYLPTFTSTSPFFTSGSTFPVIIAGGTSGGGGFAITSSFYNLLINEYTPSPALIPNSPEGIIVPFNFNPYFTGSFIELAQKAGFFTNI